MGTWDIGPFDNDGASDFVAEAGRSPKPAIQSALRRVRDAGDDYLDVDDGQHAVAAAELVALGFGYGKADGLSAEIRAVAAALGPDDALRKLAIAALPRLRDPELSELAALWHEGSDGSAFDGQLTDLIERLEAAGD
jgi:uncharacterized protein DUF4259